MFQAIVTTRWSTALEWVAGLTGSALLFDGIDDFVGTGVSLLNELDAFTLSGWFAPSVGGSVEGFFGQNDLIEFGFYQSTTLGLYTDAGGNLDFLWSYPLDEWHHVAVTGDANGVRLHIDGVQVVEELSPAASGYGSTDFPFNIGGGGIWDASGNAFAGRIDEVAVYGRALGASEIEELANPGSIVVAPTVQITSPLDGVTIAADTVDVVYTSNGDLADVSQIHRRLDGGSPLALTVLNGTTTLSGLLPGPHTVSLTLARADGTRVDQPGSTGGRHLHSTARYFRDTRLQ